jgi:tetratricopeptide (TPR) repeat protein
MTDFSPDEAFRHALAAMQANKLDRAVDLFRQVLRLRPQHIGALNFLGVLLTRSERYDEAERYIRRALKEDARSDVTFYNHGIVLKALKRPTEALEQFTRALKINASVAETWNNRGTVFSELGKYREAIADFDRAIAINPNYVDALFNKGNALAALAIYPAFDFQPRFDARAASGGWLARPRQCPLSN